MRAWQPTPVFLPGEFHDRGALWATVHGVIKELDKTERLKFEKEMAAHSSVLAPRIPGKGEPGGLPSMGLHGVGHD